MVRCVAFGCSNVLTKGCGVSFYKFPKERPRRAAWEHYCRRADFVANNYSSLCSEHFSLEMFSFHPRKFDLQLSFDKRPTLRDDAVPDIPIRLQSTAAETEIQAPRQRSAFAKRRRSEILKDAFVEHEEVLADTDSDETPPTMDSTSNSPTPLATKDSSCQYDIKQSSKSIQAGVKPQTRTRRIQVRVPVMQTSVGIQCELIKAPALQLAHAEDDHMDVDFNSSFVSEPTCSDDDDDDEDVDPDWEFDSDVDDIDDEMGDSDDDYCDMNYKLSSENNIATEKQFLVSESCLQNLLSVCRQCKLPCTTFINYTKGTMICTGSVCAAGHVFEWRSQHSHNCMPWSNLLVSAGIFFSGASFAKIKLLFNNMNMQMFCKRTFMYIQSAYLTPAVLQVWDTTKKTMFSERAGKTLVLGGDGRCDSPGYSAKYCSYSLMDLDTNTVIDLQLVQSNEVKGSTHMELEGLKRGLECLKQDDITVGTLVTDRHVMVKKYMREEQPETKHNFDVWHVSKGVTKKLEACAKKKGGENIRPWVKSASNHMYWTAMTSGDDGDLKIAKWKSLCNHIANQHNNHSEKFPSCQHGLTDRDWLEKGSRPHKMVTAIVESPYLIKDIGKLSPLHQTYGLEVFHSIVNHFAPKSRHFFYPSMLARLYIAAMHYNENGNNERGMTKDGWQICYPKAKKGKEAIVKPCRTEPTYGYVALLIQAVVERRSDIPNYRDATMDGRDNLGSLPPPLTDSFDKFDKNELISMHRSRFI